jgi:hypothetical protein
MFVALEKLDDYVDINKYWEIIRENVKTSDLDSLDSYELEEHEAWFDECCSYLLY